MCTCEHAHVTDRTPQAVAEVGHIDAWREACGKYGRAPVCTLVRMHASLWAARPCVRFFFCGKNRAARVRMPWSFSGQKKSRANSTAS